MTEDHLKRETREEKLARIHAAHVAEATETSYWAEADPENEYYCPDCGNLVPDVWRCRACQWTPETGRGVK